jgi:hypothetical protein
LPGTREVDVAGAPPGNTQEYSAALEVVAKETDAPATIVTSDDGPLITPRGGAVE